MPRRLFRSTAARLRAQFGNQLVHHLGPVARSVDQAFALAALNPPRAMRRRSPSESLGHAERMRGLAAIAGFYGREGRTAQIGSVLPEPSAIRPEVRRVRRVQRAGQWGEVLDLSWPSEFEPLWTRQRVSERFSQLSSAERSAIGVDDRQVDEMLTDLGIDKRGDLREKYLAVQPNRTAHARWFRHTRGPRPCAVLVHGYMAGSYAIEERVWPVQKLWDSGLDVVLTVLPFHGPRRAPARRYLPPAFPSNDPRFTIEGFRQMVLDHRSLFSYLSQGNVQALGVMGMSLGGYSAALLSTLDARLRYSVMFVPLAAIDEFAHKHGRMVGSASEQIEQREALRTAQLPVSPLARPSLVKPGNVLVLAGEADRVTGLAHAERLTKHFDANLVTFPGGHLLQLGKGRAFEPVFDLLEREGMLDSAP
jgi:pimeloyl-ACP methyl ester carboxylesterase